MAKLHSFCSMENDFFFYFYFFFKHLNCFECTKRNRLCVPATLEIVAPLKSVLCLKRRFGVLLFHWKGDEIQIVCHGGQNC